MKSLRSSLLASSLVVIGSFVGPQENPLPSEVPTAPQIRVESPNSAVLPLPDAAAAESEWKISSRKAGRHACLLKEDLSPLRQLIGAPAAEPVMSPATIGNQPRNAP